ncbi:MAG: TIGR02594 family protein [Hyphomicrobiaceae bacterium]
MPQPAWMEQAWAEIGQREVNGSTDNPRILDFYRAVGHPDATHDEIAWCAAFVGASLQRAGLLSSRSLMARSYLNWGETLTKGRLGAVAVFSRGSDPVAGHVAFYLDSDATRIFVLGGNQGDAVSVTAMARDQLLGLRWPTETATSDRTTETKTSVGANQSLFDVALAHVLDMEGGWTEDQYDPGGPTNFGITLATLAAHRGIVLDAASFASLRQQLREISKLEVRAIYSARYWRPCRAEALVPAVALMHFDAAVNHGVGTAARMLQEVSGTTVDGEIGPATLAACAGIPTSTILQRYAEARRTRYRTLGHFWRFGRGWLARVDATLRTASTLATTQPKGDTTMTNTNAAPTPDATQVKWWGESMTMWGALITAATTVVPVLGPIIGLDITGEMVRQLGTQGIQVAQALGGLAGTLMTIYGRVRATSRLSLRPAPSQS